MKIKHLFLIAASLILATSLASAQTYDSTETAISAPSTSDSTPNLDTTQTISPEIPTWCILINPSTATNTSGNPKAC